MEVVVKDVIESSIAISSKKGELLRNVLMNNFNDVQEFNIDFNGITDLTTAFLNVGIGHLYDSFPKNEVNSKLKFEHLDELDQYLVQQVINRVDLNNVKEQDFKDLIREVFEDGKDS